MSVNKVILVGNLGRDPELKTVRDGFTVAKFSVATQGFVNKEKVTDWHNVTVWNKLADNCAKYLTKGSQVYIEGRLQTRSWVDEKTQEKKYATDVVASDVKFLSRKSTDDNAAPKKSENYMTKSDLEASLEVGLDEIPF